MIQLGSRHTVALYLFMKNREEELDETLQQLYDELQRNLFHYLSIEEMESLAELYEKKVDVLGERGYI